FEDTMLDVLCSERVHGRHACPGGRAIAHAFLTNSDFRLMGPKPSILQSMSWSASTRRMLRTFVPIFTTPPEPLSLRSLMTVTVSPSLRILPAESFQTRSWAAGASASCADHSCAHSGQTKRGPSS